MNQIRTVFGVFFLSLAALYSCSTKEREFTTVDELMDIILEEEDLASYPRLSIDGYDINYEILRGKLTLTKKDIGFYELKEGELRIITKLPEFTEEEFVEVDAKLDGKSINYNQYRRFELDKIYKKVQLDQKTNDSISGVNQHIIWLYTKDYLQSQNNQS